MGGVAHLVALDLAGHVALVVSLGLLQSGDLANVPAGGVVLCAALEAPQVGADALEVLFVGSGHGVLSGVVDDVALGACCVLGFGNGGEGAEVVETPLR